MRQKEKYECKGCGYKVKCDPREVPFQCPDCGAIDYPFMKETEEAISADLPAWLKDTTFV